MGRVVELRAGAREPQVGDRLAFDGMGWVPEVNIARPRGVTHVHTDTVVRIVMGRWRSPDFVTGVSGWQFDAGGSLEANNITARGTIYAEAGEIAGWTLAAGHLHAGSGAGRVGLKPGSYPFYAGAEAEASAPFRVNTGGEMWATNAHITGQITATTGAIGGWTLTATEIKSGTNIVFDSSVPRIVIGSSGYIRSSNYVPGFDGFHIDAGFAEFGNVNVRGSLHCAVFVKDLISAHAGTLLVTKSAGKLFYDYTVGASMRVEDPPVAGWLFDTGDIVRLKEEYASGVYETWVTVTRTGITNQYTTTLSNGDEVTYHKGTTAVDYGQSGDGGILQTADMGNAPWLSVFTHAGAPWTTLTHHLRLGNLNGVADISSDLYGIFIGDYAGDKWMSYDPTNSLRIRGDALIDGTVTAAKVVAHTLTANEIAANTILATNLNMGIGDNIFNAADGLLLLGPNCEINDGEWWSLRKQKATITGAFHQEAGRWLGTRALVIEEVTTNLVENPSLEIDTTHWGPRGAGTTITRVTTDATHGGACLEVVAADVPSAGVYIHQGAGDKMTVAPNTAYTFSVYIKRASSTSHASNLRIEWQTAGGAAISNDTAAITLLPGWHRFSMTATSPATAGLAYLSIIRGEVGVWTYYVDAAQFEAKSCPTSYCDGDQGHEYTWSGTAHDSTSARAATVVTLPVRFISGQDTLSLGMWVQMSYDHDTAWPSTSGYLTDAEGAAGHRTIIRYNSADYKFSAYLNTGWHVVGSAQSFAAGDWVFVVLTVNYSSYEHKLYINGLLDGSSTETLGVPTLTDWKLSRRAASAGYWGNFNFAEVVVFGKVLSAAEVAAMYALQRPLVDAGAIDSPGLYILDGQFKMASSLTGARMELDEVGLVFKDGSGDILVDLDASDASFTLRSAVTGIHTEIIPAGIGIYGGTGPTGVGRLLGGRVNLTTKVLDPASGDLGWFGYDASNVLQVAWYATGDRKGEVTAAAGVIRLTSGGIETHSSGDAGQYHKWYNSDVVAAYPDHLGFANLQKTDPNANLYGILNLGLRHDANNQSGVSCWLNHVDTIVQKAGNWRYVFRVNYDWVKVEGVPFRVAVLGADPTVGVENGVLYYRTSDHKLRLRANGAWVSLN